MESHGESEVPQILGLQAEACNDRLCQNGYACMVHLVPLGNVRNLIPKHVLRLLHGINYAYIGTPYIDLCT